MVNRAGAAPARQPGGRVNNEHVLMDIHTVLREIRDALREANRLKEVELSK